LPSMHEVFGFTPSTRKRRKPKVDKGPTMQTLLKTKQNSRQ
jgi:hypothetical protein